jgi:hypothetical protein
MFTTSTIAHPPIIQFGHNLAAKCKEYPKQMYESRFPNPKFELVKQIRNEHAVIVKSELLKSSRERILEHLLSAIGQKKR